MGARRESNVEQVINVLLMSRIGRPTLNEGGPLNIIAKLLQQYSGSSLVSQAAFVSATDFFALTDVPKTIMKNSQHLRNGTRGLKRRIYDVLVHASMGHVLLLARDKYRIRQRMERMPFEPTVVHSHNPICTALMASAVPYPVITTIHYKESYIVDAIQPHFPYLKRSFAERRYTMLEKLGIQSSSAITFPSEGARKMFDVAHPGLLMDRRSDVIHNGIDLQYYLKEINSRTSARTRPEFRLINIAQMVSHKRFDLVVEIVIELLRRRIPVRLDHFGGGPLFGEYQHLVAHEGLGNVIAMHDFAPHTELVKCMAHADVHLMPSEKVVFDLVTLEAMALAVPSVVTDDGGNREVITSGHDGYLVGHGNVREFVNILEGLYKDPDRRVIIGQNAQKTIERKFTIERMASQYVSLYRQIVDEGFGS